MTEIKIGDEVFAMDGNRRRYVDGKIQFREHFYPVTVAGETSRSWIIKRGAHVEFKIPKKDPFGFHGSEFAKPKQIFTAEMVEDQVWLYENKQRIYRELMACHDASIWRALSAMLRPPADEKETASA